MIENRQLECIVCMEYMRPPILLCVNDHNICETCRPKLNNRCPICKGIISSLRNRKLENLARNIHYPCKHSRHGCRAEMPCEVLEEHESTCPYQHYKCPFTFGGMVCSWDGTAADMKTHISCMHPISVFKATGWRTILRKITFLPEHRWLEAVFALNEIFVACTVVAEGVIFHRVIFIGPEKRARQYRFRVSIVTLSGEVEIGEWKEILSYNIFMKKIEAQFQYQEVFFKEGNYFSCSQIAIDKYMNNEKCIQLREDIDRL